ncbi:MAG: Ig-like domain-containing protein [Clostridia bacterium]|nr:Ig-like domain-containing protein [Clostridia bacterium]
MKKGKTILLLSALASLVAFSAGCNPTTSSSQETARVDLKQEQVEMTIGDTQSLIAEYDKVDGETLVFESSDPSIVSVDEKGVMKALAQGTATLTVKYGEATDSAEVNVSFGEFVPVLKIPTAKNDAVQLRTSDYVDLKGVVSFNGVTFDNAELTYTLADKTLGTLTDDGVFTATKAGKTEIIITATWNGYTGETMNKTIEITALPTVEISVNRGENSGLTLYSLDDTVLPYSVQCKEDGEEIDYEVAVMSSEKYINFTPQSVQSRGLAGYAELTVTCQDSLGNEYARIIPVTVEHTLVEREETLDYFSAYDGDFVGGATLRKLLGEDITAVKDGAGNALRVENNKAYALPTKGDMATETTFTIYGSTYALKANVKAYTRVIDEAEDFSIFHTSATTWQEFAVSPAFDGYYILSNNIDAGNYMHAKVSEGLISANASMAMDTPEYKVYGGLTGTLDGNGYTIDAMTFPAYGLFGHINGGAVKNVAFTNCRFTTSSSTAVLASYVYGSNINNLYLHAEQFGGGANGVGMLWLDTCDTVVENVLIDVPVEYTGSSKAKNNGYGSLGGLYGEALAGDWAPTTYRDVFVVSPNVLVYRNNTRKLIVDGINRTQEVPEGFKYYQLEGMERYDDAAALKAANKTFNSFNTLYWEKKDGILTWKAKADPILDESQFDAIIREFSTVDGNVGSVRALFDAKPSQTVKLTAAYQGSRELTVEGTKIFGVKPAFVRESGKIVGIRMISLTVVGNVGGMEQTRQIGVYAYTHIIDEASDLAIFYEPVKDVDNRAENEKNEYLADGVTPNPDYKKSDGVDDRYVAENGSPYDGYYILKCDIDASEYVHACPNENNAFMGINAAQVLSKGINLGLKGTFDGRGHTIDGLTVGRNGLFGFVNGGVVKDVAFTNVKLASADNVIQGGLLGTYMVNATIENVYAQIVAYEKKQGVAGLWADTYGASVKNVLVVMPEITGMSAKNEQYGYGSLGIWCNDRISAEYKPSTYENVYVISKTVLSQRLNAKANQNYIADAANRTETQKPADLQSGEKTFEGKLYLLDGVERYDTANAAGNVAFGSWKIAGGAITWTKP